MKNLLSTLLCLSVAGSFFACQKSQEVKVDPESGEILSCTKPGPTGGGSTSECGQFRTQTQGGWGARPYGGNAGTYLHANFAAAFPSGLTVGCTNRGNSIYFSSAASITEFLPAGGWSGALTASAVDPAARSIRNTLIGQVTALALNVGFDFYDPNFSPADENLGNLVIASGPFAGQSVSEFLSVANDALGGCSTGYSFYQLNDAATKINENSDNGIGDSGFLNCPTTRLER